MTLVENFNFYFDYFTNITKIFNISLNYLTYHAIYFSYRKLVDGIRNNMN